MGYSGIRLTNTCIFNIFVTITLKNKMMEEGVKLHSIEICEKEEQVWGERIRISVREIEMLVPIS